MGSNQKTQFHFGRFTVGINLKRCFSFHLLLWILWVDVPERADDSVFPSIDGAEKAICWPPKTEVHQTHSNSSAVISNSHNDEHKPMGRRGAIHEREDQQTIIIIGKRIKNRSKFLFRLFQAIDWHFQIAGLLEAYSLRTESKCDDDDEDDG